MIREYRPEIGKRVRGPLLVVAVLMLLVPQMTAQQTTGQRIQREVRLYNPYRPTLSEAQKINILPDLRDTVPARPTFNYTVTPSDFMPEFEVSAIRAATVIPDPLPRLYRSHLNLGIGNHFTPVGELTIASERSRRGMLAFSARHFSSNGHVRLDNDKRVYSGYMDNEVSLYGKRFLQSSVLAGSIDFNHFTRHAYGYDTILATPELERADMRLDFIDVGADVSIASAVADSNRLIYDLRGGYNLFRQSDLLWEQQASLMLNAGTAITTFTGNRSSRSGEEDLFLSLRGNYTVAFLNDHVEERPRHRVEINPSAGKRSSEWRFNLGLKAVTESRPFDNGDEPLYDTKFHIYPDVNLTLTVIPDYLDFTVFLDGELEDNSARKAVRVNPFLQTSGYLFKLPSTSHQIRAGASLSGSLDGGVRYRLRGGYSVLKDMVFFSNVVWTDAIFNEGYGGHFMPEYSDGNLMHLSGELRGDLSPRLQTAIRGDYYGYSLTAFDTTFNRPEWEGEFSIRYNLRDKILAGAGLNAVGQREASVLRFSDSGQQRERTIKSLPMHLNINLSAEYRFTNILSFWLRAHNIGVNRGYEWALYPSQRLIVTGGFSYSL